MATPWYFYGVEEDNGEFPFTYSDDDFIPTDTEEDCDLIPTDTEEDYDFIPPDTEEDCDLIPTDAEEDYDFIPPDTEEDYNEFIPTDTEEDNELTPTDTVDYSDFIPTDTEDYNDFTPTDTEEDYNLIPTDTEEDYDFIPPDTEDYNDFTPTDTEEDYNLIPTDTEEDYDFIPPDTEDYNDFTPTDTEEDYDLIPTDTEEDYDFIPPDPAEDCNESLTSKEVYKDDFIPKNDNSAGGLPRESEHCNEHEQTYNYYEQKEQRCEQGEEENAVREGGEEDSDEEKESPEYKSFCQHRNQLLHVISNPENFAKQLFSAHIISGRVLSGIQKRRRAKHQVSSFFDKKKLLKIVKNVIQADSGKFEALLEVMSQNSPSVATMADKLRKSCAGNRLSSTCTSHSNESRFAISSSEQKTSFMNSSDCLKKNHQSSFTASFSDSTQSGSTIGKGAPTFLDSPHHTSPPQLKVQDLVIETPEDQIGAGAFGDVWKATRSGSPCAVKVLHGVNLFLPLHGSVNSEKQEKFQSECIFLGQLKHINIVQYLQTYIHPQSGTPLLAMELMDENLTNFLERYGKTFGNKLSKCIQMKICKDVAEALNYLHSLPVVHRDLSSHNILLLGSTNPMISCQHICAKVSDFGISRLIDNERFDKTLSTVAPGTKGYMPPESWNCHAKYDEKFDIFSFGVLVLQIITLLPPKPGDRVNSSNMIVSEVKRRANHLKQIEGHPLKYLVSCCLQDRKDTRPSASKICHMLQRRRISCSCIACSKVVK